MEETMIRTILLPIVTAFFVCSLMYVTGCGSLSVHSYIITHDKGHMSLSDVAIVMVDNVNIISIDGNSEVTAKGINTFHDSEDVIELLPGDHILCATIPPTTPGLIDAIEGRSYKSANSLTSLVHAKSGHVYRATKNVYFPGNTFYEGDGVHAYWKFVIWDVTDHDSTKEWMDMINRKRMAR